MTSISLANSRSLSAFVGHLPVIVAEKQMPLQSQTFVSATELFFFATYYIIQNIRSFCTTFLRSARDWYCLPTVKLL